MTKVAPTFSRGPMADNLAAPQDAVPHHIVRTIMRDAISPQGVGRRLAACARWKPSRALSVAAARETAPDLRANFSGASNRRCRLFHEQSVLYLFGVMHAATSFSPRCALCPTRRRAGADTRTL